jgi:membrane-bound metal-dependent hydrolase YbcI (DUF457 family)
MTAAHFAAALAIKSRVPKAGTAALIVGAFIPDFIWIALATAGIEPTNREIFFDDWSHSLLSIVLCASLYAFIVARATRSSTPSRTPNREVGVAMWLAVFSHFILDLPVHPKPLALYPHSSVRLSLGLSSIPSMSYWYIQLAVVLALVAIYVHGTLRLRIPPKLIAATCTLLIGWHICLMPG